MNSNLNAVVTGLWKRFEATTDISGKKYVTCKVLINGAVRENSVSEITQILTLH